MGLSLPSKNPSPLPFKNKYLELKDLKQTFTGTVITLNQTPLFFYIATI